MFPVVDVNPLKAFLLDPTEHRGDCPAGWESFGDSCFFFSDEERTWYDAESACQEMPDAHLASCMPDNEFAFVANILGAENKEENWIGYSDL